MFTVVDPSIPVNDVPSAVNSESVSSYATVNSSVSDCAEPFASTISISSISQFEFNCSCFTTDSNLIKPRSLFSARAFEVATVTFVASVPKLVM